MQGVVHAFGRSCESSMPGVVLASALPDLNASAGYWREALLTPLGNDSGTIRLVLLSENFVIREEPIRCEISSSPAPVFAR